MFRGTRISLKKHRAVFAMSQPDVDLMSQNDDVSNLCFHKNEVKLIIIRAAQCKQYKFDEFISPDEGLFERKMQITKHKSHIQIITNALVLRYKNK